VNLHPGEHSNNSAAHCTAGKRGSTRQLDTRSWTAALVVIVLLALTLRIFGLDAKSVFADESASFRFAQLDWTGFWNTITSREANMALYYIVMRFWIRISSAVWFVRLFSALAAVATVPVVFFLGRRLFSAEAALFGSALLALNSFHILYSQAARGYTLAVLLVTLCSLYFIRALEEADWHPAGAYVVSATAALYAHFFAAFVLLAQLFSLFFLKSQSRIVRRQIGLMLLVAGLGTPLAAFGAVHKTDPIFWLDHPSIRDVHHLFTYFFGSGLKFGLSALSIILAAREWWRRASSSTQRAYESAWVYVFVGLWLAVPVALTLLISHWRPVFSPRFLMICLPAVVLLVGEGLSSVKRPIARYGFAAVLFTSAIMALPSYYRRPGLEDWRGVADYLTKNVQPSDVIVVDVYYRDAFDIAFRQSQQNCPTQKVMPLLPGRNVLKDVHRIWIVSCHPTRKAHDEVRATPRDFFLHSKANFVGIEVLRFEKSPAVK
jgi:mannosyltransferase